MSVGLLDEADATRAPDCTIPKVSAGSNVKYATKYDSNNWFSARVLQVWGCGRLTVRYTDANGIDITRENVCYHEDPFARYREYVASNEQHGEGGVWKLDDAQAEVHAKIEQLESQLAELSGRGKRKAKGDDTLPAADGGPF